MVETPLVQAREVSVSNTTNTDADERARSEKLKQLHPPYTRNDRDLTENPVVRSGVEAKIIDDTKGIPARHTVDPSDNNGNLYKDGSNTPSIEVPHPQKDGDSSASNSTPRYAPRTWTDENATGNFATSELTNKGCTPKDQKESGTARKTSREDDEDPCTREAEVLPPRLSPSPNTR